MFQPVNQRQSFPELELKILNFWKENDVFRQSIENRKNAKEYTFYDGPPFATGLPHYGHLVGGTLKDVIPRYQTMRGYRVERRFGWDCHGLPVENLIEKELNLSDRDALVEYGIGNFNEACRASVLRYANEWEEIVERMGRWVDFKNDYKTMDPEFMESVWWVFDQLWQKGLVYEGHKPMHICPRCVTALSNFEVNLGYKDVTDQSVVVKFRLVESEESGVGSLEIPLRGQGGVDSNEVTDSGQARKTEQTPTYFLAWTTTPWTLPGNLALAVHPEVSYVKLKIKDEKLKIEEYYILAKDLIETVIGEREYEIVAEFKGSELVKKYPTYEPLFDSFAHLKETKNSIRNSELVPLNKGDAGGSKTQGEQQTPQPPFQRGVEQTAFKVVTADFVTTDSGTGIVHIAPAFGEDDLNVGKENNLPWVQHVKMDGKFVAEVKEFAGQEVKPKDDSMKTDRKIVEFLKKQNKVFEAKTYRHSYPHCWRCDTPLLNYATSSWFVKVEEIKQMLLENNQKVHWVPDHLKDGRFGKWLEGARDWAISRTRYWGTPLPIWRCENEECKHTESLGSIEQLEQKTGEKVYDIHKHFVDDLTWDCPHCSAKMKRIEEVFDCWFESGSMPYAQKHYPFAYNRKLKNTYYLLRHGEGEHNVNGLISCDPEDGCTNTNLTEKGREMVKENVEMFREINVDVIYSSDFLRTKQTAEILNEVAQTELVFDERLREFNIGEFHGKDISEYESAFAKKEERWTKAAKGGETYQEVEDRMSAAFHEYEAKHEGKTIVIVSHGDPLKILLGYLNAEFKKITAYAHCPKVGVPQKIDLKTEADFQAQYPADFIAEGLDQTRGWFYTLHVLGSALFGKNAYQNVITNGIVLAEDGQKMSKSKQNYPDPNLVFENYGADAMRFYLMNSPVVKADDLRFSEHGVNEVVKGMILPLWNAYAFFVTYANIDGWKPKSLEFRVQSLENESGGAEVPLEKGDLGGFVPVEKIEIRELKSKAEKELFRKFVSAEMYLPTGRPELAQKEIDKLEVLFGAFYNDEIVGSVSLEKIDQEISELWYVNVKEGFRRKKIATLLMNKTLEYAKLQDYKVCKINARVSAMSFYETFQPKHAGSFNETESGEHEILEIDLDKFEVQDSGQAGMTKSNKLDQWILSVLNQLIADVTTEMENYDLQKAAQPIFGFIDNLTNWYIRRSRRRFWKSENDTDKNEAYATLYEVLVKTSQVIAPFMPFSAEEIYQNLAVSHEPRAESDSIHLEGDKGGVKPQGEQGINTNQADIAQESNEANSKVQVGDVEPTVLVNSVHLTDWPEVDYTQLNPKLNAEMSAIQQIVKLGLVARAKAKIKVRQPLPKLQLALSDKYDLNAIQTEFEVIQEELNIKEIEIIKNAEEIAQVMASPNARLLGPKYGKEVQNIIREAKSGNFEKMENGNYKILDFEILPEEIEIVYQGKEGFNVEADQGIVVGLDTHISAELKQEGIARELVRYIQDMRKEADFNVEDRIELFMQTQSSELKQVLTMFENYLKSETLSESLHLNQSEKNKPEKEFEIEGEKINISLRGL